MQHENEATPPSLPPRPKNSSVPGPSIPPQRAQSDVVLEAQKPNIEKQVKSSIDVNGHYAHLDKHLKEVRRRKKTSKPLMPSLSNFQLKKENEQTVSTDWIQYIKAVSQILCASQTVQSELTLISGSNLLSALPPTMKLIGHLSLFL